jgi:hypothetical protein
MVAATGDSGCMVVTTTLWRTIVLLSAVPLVGCGTVVDGQPSREGIASVEGALPDAAELQTVLGLPLEADGAPTVGPEQALRNDADEYTSPQCARVTHPLLRGTYERTGAVGVASGRWETVDRPAGSPGTVRVGIVEMGSPASANSFYADSAASWADCRGHTVAHQIADTATLVDDVVDVTESGGVLSAELVVTDEVGAMTPMPHQRALGVVSRYVVDVDVLGNSWPATAPGDADRATSVARLTVEKISAAL